MPIASSFCSLEKDGKDTVSQKNCLKQAIAQGLLYLFTVTWIKIVDGRMDTLHFLAILLPTNFLVYLGTGGD